MGSTLRAISRTEIEAYGYDEFGNNLYPQKSVCQSIGFTGYLSDEEAGTSYAKAREYLPQIGRFAAEDVYGGSIAVPYSQNRYSYCYNNPLVLVDGDGRKPTWKSIQEELDELGDKAKKGVSNVIRGFEENFWRKYVVGEDIILDRKKWYGNEYMLTGHTGGDIFIWEKEKKEITGWHMDFDLRGDGKESRLSGKNADISTWKYESNITQTVENGEYTRTIISSGIFFDNNDIGMKMETSGGIENIPLPLPDGINVEDFASMTWSVTAEKHIVTWKTVKEFAEVSVGIFLAALLLMDDTTVIGAADDPLLVYILEKVAEKSPTIYQNIIKILPQLQNLQNIITNYE